MSRRGGAARGVRAAIAVCLVVLGCLLSPLAVAAAWVGTQISDPDRYVETVAPLGSDPAVQEALADRVTAELVKRLDLERIVGEATNAVSGLDLPPRTSAAIRGLAGPLADGLESVVRSEVGNAVRSEAFERAWVRANRAVHVELVKAMEGRSNLLLVRGETVRLDLAPLIEVVKTRLSARLPLVAELPAVPVSIALFTTAELVRWQTWYRWLNRLAWALPLLALGLLAAGVLVSPRRRVFLLGGGLGVAAAMTLLFVGLVVARERLLSGLPAGVPRDARAMIFDSIVRFLQVDLGLVVIVALVVALVAYLAGRRRSLPPGEPAVEPNE